MPEPPFVITDSFFIQGRGLALLFSWDREADPPVRVKLGDEIELTSLDGVSIRTQVKGVELIHAALPRPHQTSLGILISLPPEYGVRLRGAKAQVVTEIVKS